MSTAPAERYAPKGYLLAGCVVSPAMQPVLKAVLDELKERNPKATAEQLVDAVFEAGMRQLFVHFGLPRPGSNPDEDA